MNKELISDSVNLIDPFSGLFIKYALNIVENPKNSISNKLKRIENNLGFTKKNLNKKEFEFISYILEIAHAKNESIDNIDISCQKIQEFFNLSKEELEDIQYSLGDLLNVYQATSKFCLFKLDYALYWKTNYLELINNNALSFENLFFTMIEYLYQNMRYEDNEINVKLFNDFFNTEQINILLAYFKEINLATNINYRRPQVEFYYWSFIIDKNILYRQYKNLQE